MVLIRSRTGEVLELPEKWATLLAENLRACVSVYSVEARSAADKIESRLVGADDTPVEFDTDEDIEVLEGLTAVCEGWHKSEGGAWKESEAHAFYWSFEGSGKPE
jgi:hypothetical protein